MVCATEKRLLLHILELLVHRHNNCQLPQDCLVQQQHAATLNTCPDDTRANTAEPSANAFGLVDKLEAPDDGRGLEVDSARFRCVR